MKINFTQEHLAKLKELAIEMLLSNKVISTKMGQVLNVCEIFHTTTINTLNSIKQNLSKQIESLEEADEWVGVNSEQIGDLKNLKEFINLVIGYRRYNIELTEKAAKKAKLEKQLAELEASTKTPQERIAELKAQIAEL